MTVLKKGNILIVDDLPDNLRLLRDTLQGEGYKIRSCTTGAMALRGSKAAQTDLILLDIKLPDCDGYEVCRQLKANEQTAHIPVIFLSALTNTFDKVRGLAVGGADYITKPFQIEEVLARVETQLSIQRLQKSIQEKNLHLTQEIAEHKRTQEALFFEKELAQVTLKSIGDAVITTNGEGYVTSLNPMAENLTGWSEKEAQGLHLFEVFKIINALTKETVENPIVKALDEVRIVNLAKNTILIARDGREFSIDDSASPIQDSQGQVIGAVIVFRDITDYKREEEAKLNNILNRAIAAITRYRAFPDQTWVSDYWSGGCELLLGYTAEELIADQNIWTKNVHPEDLKSLVQQAFTEDKTTRTSDVEYRFRHKDGTQRWISSSQLFEWDETHNYWLVTGVLNDITQRKQIEIALREEEKKLNLFVRYAPVSVAMFDHKMRYLAVSQRWLDMYKLGSRETVIGRSHYEVFPNIPDSWKQVHQECLAGAVKKCDEDCFILPDGSAQWLKWEVLPWLLDTEEVGGILIFVEDITQRKQVEIALQEQIARERIITNIAQNIRETLDLEQVLQSTVEQVQELLKADRVLVFRFDRDGQGKVIAESLKGEWLSMLSQTFNDHSIAEQYFTCSPKEFYARTDISTVETEPCYREFFEPFQLKASLTVPILQTQLLWGFLIVHQCSSTRKWQTTEIELLQQLAIQVSIAIQQSELYEKTRQELLERQKAERKIAEQAALIDITTDAIFVQDLENNILFFNQGAERLYGWNFTEVKGQKTLTLFNQDLEIHEALQTTIDQGSWQGEIAQITKKGKKIIVASRWTLVENELDEPKSILIVNSDITERKKLEKQFYHVQRLESIGTLASGIAHDFNNILTPILIVSQMLPVQIPNLDERTERLLMTLSNSAKRAVNLVKQILFFSRTTEGQFVMLQLGYLLLEVISVAKQTFPKFIAISGQIPSTELWTISADGTQMHQVFMNLMINARDAMPEGGDLKITAENRHLDEYYAHLNLEAKAGPYVVVKIADTGTGIPPELLERIFDPFFTTKEVGKGTGLGLSTVMGIVKNHGGFVKVSSEVGKGTEFEVFLPAIEGKEQEETLKEEMPRGNGELILIVDDEPAIQEITKTALESYNYRTLIASDGIEALAFYAQNQQEISVVVMDIMMPNLDGVTTIRALQKMNPQVKVIAISGLIANKQLAIQAKVQTFLLKPYTVGQLLQTLKEVIEIKNAP
jgi:two-component system, cell cycle sensor histidine kinase and response regulator CckA